MSTNVNVDRNLLFAVIALQDDLIDQTQFADVCAGWAMRLDRPLSDLLIERKWITEADRTEVERKLERKLKKNQGDVRATLGAVAEIEAREVLQAIKNPKVRQSIHALPPARGHVLVETLVPPPAQRDSLRYTLTRLHAEGGLGKIWIAHDTDLNRDVALKEIKSSTVPNPESWRRFLKEAQITGQLEHPNIVPVYELARRKEDDQPFYTMRFLRGQTLRNAIAEFHRRRAGKPAHRLELQRQLLEPFVKVCQAVGYAHSRWVIHRDLKPENVVLGAHGEVVLLDWGLAKVVGQTGDDETSRYEPRISLSAEAETKQTVGQVGTPAYMAPEQVEADNDLIGTRTDVYGLGAILFEILTANPPVTGSSVGEVFSKIQAGDIPRAREIEPTRATRARGRLLEGDGTQAGRSLRPRGRPCRGRAPMDRRRTGLGPSRSTRRSSLALGPAPSHAGDQSGGSSRDRGDRPVDRCGAHRPRARPHRSPAHDRQQQRRRAPCTTCASPRMPPTGCWERLPTSIWPISLKWSRCDSGCSRRPEQDTSNSWSRREMIRWFAGAPCGHRCVWVTFRPSWEIRPKPKPLIAPPGESSRASRRKIRRTPMVRRDLARDLHGLGVLLKDANRFQEGEAKLREAIRLREEIAELPDATAEDKQALADSRYQLGALLARRGAGSAEDLAVYRGALEVQEALVKEFGDRPEFQTKLVRYRNNLAILQRALGSLGRIGSDAARDARLTRSFNRRSRSAARARWQVARVSNNLGALLLNKRT